MIFLTYYHSIDGDFPEIVAIWRKQINLVAVDNLDDWVIRQLDAFENVVRVTRQQ